MSTILKDLGKTKSIIISSFINSPDIYELLTEKVEYTENESESLIYEQIFPYLYVDETQTKTLTYIGVETDMNSRSPTIKDLVITVLVYCHKDIMKYKKSGYLGTRVDILSDIVEKVIRNLDLGIGKAYLKNVPHTFIGNKYYGRQLTFTIPDFKFKD